MALDLTGGGGALYIFIEIKRLASNYRYCLSTKRCAENIAQYNAEKVVARRIIMVQADN